MSILGKSLINEIINTLSASCCATSDQMTIRKKNLFPNSLKAELYWISKLWSVQWRKAVNRVFLSLWLIEVSPCAFCSPVCLYLWISAEDGSLYFILNVYRCADGSEWLSHIWSKKQSLFWSGEMLQKLVYCLIFMFRHNEVILLWPGSMENR